SARHTDDQRGGAAARRAPYNPDACPRNGPAGTGLRPARCAASSCPVADRTSEKECESDQPVTRVPSEKLGLKDAPRVRERPVGGRKGRNAGGLRCASRPRRRRLPSGYGSPVTDEASPA